MAIYIDPSSGGEIVSLKGIRKDSFPVIKFF